MYIQVHICGGSPFSGLVEAPYVTQEFTTLGVSPNLLLTYQPGFIYPGWTLL